MDIAREPTQAIWHTTYRSRTRSNCVADGVGDLAAIVSLAIRCPCAVLASASPDALSVTAALVEADTVPPRVQTYPVGHPPKTMALSAAFDELIELVAKRNADFYEAVEGNLRRAS